MTPPLCKRAVLSRTRDRFAAGLDLVIEQNPCDFFANLPAHRPTNEYGNGSPVDQSVARKAQQEPEGEMEETETAAAAEALGYRSRPAVEHPGSEQRFASITASSSGAFIDPTAAPVFASRTDNSRRDRPLARQCCSTEGHWE